MIPYKYKLFLVAQWQGVRLRLHLVTQRKIPGSTPGKEVVIFFLPVKKKKYFNQIMIENTATRKKQNTNN